MNTDQAKKLSEDALTRLMEALERGHSETLKHYLATMSRFHRYSWGNCLMIHSQRPDATHVAGFQAWLKMRRYVRKGEKGIVIPAPLVGRKRSDDEASPKILGPAFSGSVLRTCSTSRRRTASRCPSSPQSKAIPATI